MIVHLPSSKELGGSSSGDKVLFPWHYTWKQWCDTRHITCPYRPENNICWTLVLCSDVWFPSFPHSDGKQEVTPVEAEPLWARWFNETPRTQPWNLVDCKGENERGIMQSPPLFPDILLFLFKIMLWYSVSQGSSGGNHHLHMHSFKKGSSWSLIFIAVYQLRNLDWNTAQPPVSLGYFHPLSFHSFCFVNNLVINTSRKKKPLRVHFWTWEFISLRTGSAGA